MSVQIDCLNNNLGNVHDRRKIVACRPISSVDGSVTNIYTGVQNLQGRIDLLEMNLKEQFQSKINDITRQLEVQKSRQNRGLMLNYIIIVLLIVVIGLAFWGIRVKF